MLDSNEKKYSIHLLIWTSLFFCFLIASIPFLEFGFSGDDIFNSQIRGMLLTGHKTLTTFTLEIIRGWINVGRLYPITFFTTYSLFNTIGDNLILYNFIHWIALLFSLFFTSFFLYKLTQRKEDVVLFLMMLPFCWSLAPNSPWVAQAFLLPLIISFIMLSLIHYVNFIQFNNIKYLIYSSLFLLLSLFTYEIALVIPAITLLLNKWLKNYNSKQKFIAFTVIILITAIYLVTVISLRQIYSGSYAGTTLGSIKAFPVTFFKQLMGELPLMNVVYLHAQLKYIHLSSNSYFIAFLLTIFSTALIYSQLKKTKPIQGIAWLIMISLLLQIIPAALVGLSERYQSELVIGASHIPVILQQIGLCIMLVLIINYLLLSPNKKFIYIKSTLAILLGGFIGLSFIANQKTADWFNHTNRYSRDIYEKSIERGLFDSLPPNSTLLKAAEGSEMLWNSTKLRAQLVDRGDLLLFDLYTGEAPVLDKESEKFLDFDKNTLYYLDASHLTKSPKSGYTLIGHIKNHTGSQPRLILELDKIKIIYFAQSEHDLEEILKEITKKYAAIDAKILKKNQQQSSKSSGYILISSSILFNTASG